MKKTIRTIITFIIILSFTLGSILTQGSISFTTKAQAATFDDINQQSVFLKQQTTYTCTLSSAVMLMRRTAMMSGNPNWSAITESSTRPTAWLEGTGLYNKFTYSGIQVSSGYFSADRTNELINLLVAHPEGIVVYDYAIPHAILITDYTNGTFYCADPSSNRAAGRFALTPNSSAVQIGNIDKYWYVTSPTVTLTPTDTQAPSITSVNLETQNVTSLGYVLNCTFPDNEGVTNVLFPTWTENNGQDDIVWHKANMSGSSAWVYIPSSDHKDETGKYITHVYVYDAAGNYSVKPISVNLEDGSVPTQIRRTVKDGIYTLKNDTGSFMDNKDGTDKNGNVLINYSFNGSNAQQFEVKYVGDGKYRLYNLSSSQRVIDVYRGPSYSDSIDQGDTIDIWETNDDEAQLFYIVPLGDNKFAFELAAKDNYVIGGKHVYTGSGLYLQRYISNAPSVRWSLCDLNGNSVNPTYQEDISAKSLSLSTTSYTYDGTAKQPSVTLSGLTQGIDYTVAYSNNINAGTATVTITGKGNYTGTKKVYFTINKKSILALSATLSTKTYTYNGNVRKPTVILKDGSTTLKLDASYTVTYSTNKNPGTAAVTITGKGNYFGTRKLSFKINMGTPKITVSSSAKKKVTINWCKITGATGYELYMAPSKTGTYKKIATTSSSIAWYIKTGLSSGKLYYFKAYAYRTVNKTKIYSQCSSIVAVKVK